MAYNIHNREGTIRHLRLKKQNRLLPGLKDEAAFSLLAQANV